MKKLVIAAVAIAFAAAAQAATVTWSALANGTKLSDGSTGAGITAYLFDSYLTTATVESIAKGTWTPSGEVASGTTATNGALTKAGLGSYEKQDVSFSMVLLNAASYGTATQFKYVEMAPITFVTSNKTANFTTSLASTQWVDIAPEPTSGLMMLLGMGVLALRRRRA